MFNSSSVALSASVGKSIWYRASVSGTTKVTLKIEYSTDGENWNVGTVTTDEGGDFRQGATQFVWGLAASTNNFLIDDIAFEGITYDEGVVTGKNKSDGKGKERVWISFCLFPLNEKTK